MILHWLDFRYQIYAHQGSSAFFTKQKKSWITNKTINNHLQIIKLSSVKHANVALLHINL